VHIGLAKAFCPKIRKSNQQICEKKVTLLTLKIVIQWHILCSLKIKIIVINQGGTMSYMNKNLSLLVSALVVISYASAVQAEGSSSTSGSTGARNSATGPEAGSANELNSSGISGGDATDTTMSPSVPDRSGAAAGTGSSTGTSSGSTAGTSTSTTDTSHDKSGRSKMSSNDIQKHMYDRSAVISFEPGKSDLTQANQAKLQDLVSKLGGGDKIGRVEVAAWSDKEFPRTGKDLPDSDQDLAEKRGEAIQDYLKNSLSISRVKNFNMAETSNWLARVFRTDDAEIKSVFSKDMNAPMAREDFNLISKNGAPSRAVVVLVPKTKMASDKSSSDSESESSY
jgi:outer membrane protein OmpA-like peptidoglycan-associated protein